MNNSKDKNLSKEPLSDFSEVVFQHGKYLRGFIAKNCWDKQDIDDIYQTSLLEAFRSYGSFRGDSQIKTWLCGIAIMVFRNKARKMNKSKMCSLEDMMVAETMESSKFDQPEKAMELDRLLYSVKDTTNKLPNSVKSVYMAVALQGKNYEQTAIEFNIPVGTVRSRVSRARTLMREKNSQFLSAND